MIQFSKPFIAYLVFIALVLVTAVIVLFIRQGTYTPLEITTDHYLGDEYVGTYRCNQVFTEKPSADFNDSQYPQIKYHLHCRDMEDRKLLPSRNTNIFHFYKSISQNGEKTWSVIHDENVSHHGLRYYPTVLE